MAVIVEKSGPVTTIVLSRPEVKNAVDPATARELHKRFLAFEADPDARVAVFYGAGGSFCAGYDLKALSSGEGAEWAEAIQFPEDSSRPTPPGPMGPSRLELSKPVIAAVEGPAVAGGTELALWCDFRVMAEDAYFGIYCRRWGVPLIDGGTVRLPRLVGLGRALEIILTGRAGAGARDHLDRAQGPGRGGLAYRALRVRRRARCGARQGGSARP